MVQSFNQDIGRWDVSKVPSMKDMFNEASSFNQDLSAWDIQNVQDFESMFYGANLFNRDLCGWGVKIQSNAMVWVDMESKLPVATCLSIQSNLLISYRIYLFQIELRIYGSSRF